MIMFKDTAEAACAYPLSQTTWHAADDALICATMGGSTKQAVSIACADGTSTARLKDVLNALAKFAHKRSNEVVVITDDVDTTLNIVAGLGATTITAADVG
jgi:phenylpyruvate tautomerase PptA (4-oxalocrotonate tautomerase family)